jgi:hypothetical protein
MTTKRRALDEAVEAARKAVQLAQTRGASGETVQALQVALTHLVADDSRVGAGPVCRCGEVLAVHNFNLQRVDQFRDGHGMLWGEDTLCAGFTPA